MKTASNQIQYWAHMLDECMSEKACNALHESTDEAKAKNYRLAISQCEKELKEVVKRYDFLDEVVFDDDCFYVNLANKDDMSKDEKFKEAYSKIDKIAHDWFPKCKVDYDCDGNLNYIGWVTQSFFEESQSLNEGGEWIQKEPKTLEEHINALESLVSDLVYELDERGGYPLLDDAISVAKDTFKRLRQLANVDDTPSYVIGEAAKGN